MGRMQRDDVWYKEWEMRRPTLRSISCLHDEFLAQEKTTISFLFNTKCTENFQVFHSANKVIIK